MAKITFDSLRKREILYSSKLSAEEFSQMARAYLEMDHPGDAVQYFEKAGGPDSTEALKKLAMQEGDSFILAVCARVDPESVGEKEWKKVAARARELGKESYALRAEHIMGGGDPMGPIRDPEDPEES